MKAKQDIWSGGRFSHIPSRVIFGIAEAMNLRAGSPEVNAEKIARTGNAMRRAGKVVGNVSKNIFTGMRFPHSKDQ